MNLIEKWKECRKDIKRRIFKIYQITAIIAIIAMILFYPINQFHDIFIVASVPFAVCLLDLVVIRKERKLAIILAFFAVLSLMPYLIYHFLL